MYYRPTCSGKTTLAQQLQDEFLHTILISQDSFYLVRTSAKEHSHFIDCGIIVELQDETLLQKCSNGMYNWDGELVRHWLLQVFHHEYPTTSLGSRPLPLKGTEATQLHVVLPPSVPQSLNQEALLHAVQEACSKPHVFCQHCTCPKGFDVSGTSCCTHILIIEGTMILALL